LGEHPGSPKSGKEFWALLGERQQAQMEVLFERFTQQGYISNPEHFKKLAGTDLWEFKRFQVRLICCMKGRDAVICLGIIKKQDRHKSSDLERAAAICAADRRKH